MTTITVLTMAALIAATPAMAQLEATRITVSNASSLLFGGTDADGGVDDWYLSNGVVEAIIDDAGPQPDLIGLLGAAAPPRQNEAAFTGGTLIDLGLVGAENDQLAQMFSVGGLSTSNFVLYDTISASTTASSATITARGTLVGFAPVDPSDLQVVTEYSAFGSDPFVTVTTTVTNRDPVNTASGLGGLLDVFVWTLRGLVPFSPLPGRGFDHVELDFSNPAAALELPAFVASPGNVGPEDGVMDPNTGSAAGEVAYGILGVEARLDPDGPAGPLPETVAPVNTLFGVNSSLVSADGNLPLGSLPPGGRLVYVRRLHVGDRNDVASVANEMIDELARRQGFATGTVSGDLDAVDADGVEASAIATRTGGPAIASFPDGTPATQFRTDPGDGTFGGIRLPEGVYDLEFRAPERDPVVASGVTVIGGMDTAVSVPPMSGLGRLEFEVLEVGRRPWLRFWRRPPPPPFRHRAPPLLWRRAPPLLWHRAAPLPHRPGRRGRLPARVTFKGIDGTPDPDFSRDIDAFSLSGGPPEDIEIDTFGGGPAQRNFLYLADGTGSVEIRPGRYELFISAGPEYSLRRRRIRVREPRFRRDGSLMKRTRRIRTRLRRIVDTRGALSADFHIHSARSFDASAPLRDRVGSFAGEGVEVMVGTDHDFVVDYAPIIAALGLGHRVTSVVGEEVTTSVPNPPTFPDSLGHLNAWPLSVASEGRNDGAIEDEYVAPNFLYSRLRGLGAEVIQYNHPRAGVSGLTTIGFFNNIGYDPDLPIDVAPNAVLLDDDVTGSSGVSNPDGHRNIDFDAIEVINGTRVGSYVQMRRDWLSLLNQTNLETAFGPVPFIAGTGVSDSHRLTLETAGYARTYVLGAGDEPARLDVDRFNDNVRGGRMVATTGPYIELAVRDSAGRRAGVGDTLVPATGPLTLEIRVQATHWIPVEEVRIVSNGFVERTYDETTVPAVAPPPGPPWSQSSSVVRFEAEIPFAVSGDAYVLVEAGARLDPLPSSPPFVDRIVPGMVPLAFTNPVFVDLAGDGFDPPGLPVEPLPASAARAALVEGIASAPAEGGTLDGLRAEKREEVLRHFPIHRIAIPSDAVGELLGD